MWISGDKLQLSAKFSAHFLVWFWDGPGPSGLFSQALSLAEEGRERVKKGRERPGPSQNQAYR